MIKSLEPDDRRLDELLARPMPERRDDHFVDDVLRRLGPPNWNPSLALRPLLLAAAGAIGLAAIFIGINSFGLPSLPPSLAMPPDVPLALDSWITILLVILLSVAVPLFVTVDD